MKKTAILFYLLINTFLSFALKPKREFALTPDSLGLKYSSQQVVTSDKATLCLWDITPSVQNENNKITIIGCYQDMGNMGNCLQNAQAFSRLGYRVVLFDYRGFGCSSDFKMDENRLFYTEFVKDLDAVISYEKRKGGFDKMGVWASSMGTIVTTLSKQKIDFFIADSYPTNIDLVVEKIKQYKNKTLSLPISGKEYLEQIKNNTVPKLVFAGNKDEMIDRSILKELHNCTVVDYEGGHLQAGQIFTQQSYADIYTQKIDDFLKTTLR